MHVVVQTNPSISFYSCPQCGGGGPEARHANRHCLRPPEGTCLPLDTSPGSVFEARVHTLRGASGAGCFGSTELQVAW